MPPCPLRWWEHRHSKNTSITLLKTAFTFNNTPGIISSTVKERGKKFPTNKTPTLPLRLDLWFRITSPLKAPFQSLVRNLWSPWLILPCWQESEGSCTLTLKLEFPYYFFWLCLAVFCNLLFSVFNQSVMSSSMSSFHCLFLKMFFSSFTRSSVKTIIFQLRGGGRVSTVTRAPSPKGASSLHHH